MKFILASGSPRRLQLLRQIGLNPEVVVSHAEEEKNDLSPELLVEHNALIKGREVAKEIGPEALVLAADTVVALEGKILGKPGTPEKAADMLRLLSGKTHHVLTGIALFYQGRELTHVETTEVEFAALSEKDIARYVQTGEPLDKAGAYGIQGAAALFIPQISGSFSNVVGLPLYAVKKCIAEMDGTLYDALFDQRDASGRKTP